MNSPAGVWDSWSLEEPGEEERQEREENQEKEAQRQKNDAIELQRFITKWGRFMHPCSYGEIESYVKQHPELMDKIKVVNPPIDTSLFEIL